VQKLANQIELGIPVNSALRNFAFDVDNVVISRAVALIIEAERAGGEINYILDSVAKSIDEVEKLKKERKAAIYSLVVQGYIIFFIFLGIMLIMQFKIIPLVGESKFADLTKMNDLAKAYGSSTSTKDIPKLQVANQFLYLLVTQGFFAGLAIGKLTEGSVRNGVKHSFILAVVAFLVSTGANSIFG
jgi:flagellar protein FlaJ